MRSSNHNNLSWRLSCLIILILPSPILFGWSHLNIWYYGVRYAKNCHPDNLWTKYFTHSKYVKKFREENGEPDVIEVRRAFQTEKKARNWESKVLKRIKAVGSEKWLNKTDNKAIDPKCCSNPGEKNGMHGKTHSQEVKDFISKNNKGREITKERRKQLSEQTTGAGNPNYGKHRPHTEEEKDIIRLASKKMWESEEHRKNMSIKHQGQSNSFYGKTHSEETKEKMRKSHRRNWALKRGQNEL